MNRSILNATERPVRVCFVIENLIPAGTELWIVRLIERLDRALVSPTLCILDGSADSSRDLEPADCPVLRLGMRNLKSTRVLASARQFRKFLRQQCVDLVQVHHADPTYFGVPVARWARVPFVVQTKYDVGYWLKGPDLWLHRLCRRFVDVTIANCEACRQAAIAQEWSPETRVEILDNGIAQDHLRGIPGLTESDFHPSVNIGLLANLRPIKDPECFVRAAAIVLRRFPAARFHLAGQGPLLPSLQLLASELKIDEAVRFHGYVEDTAKFLESMAISVLCSQSEGLPHALLEAMAAGRAVVATRVGGNVELIDDGRTGMLVDAGKPEVLADTLMTLISDPPRAICLGNAARERVTSHFDLDSMARRFEHFYRRLMNGHGDA